MCEALVMGKIKDDKIGKTCMFQDGGQPGHSPEEHIFNLMSLQALLEGSGSGSVRH